jgi:hypothetical protein
MVVAYRLPKAGGKAAELVMKYCVKKLIKYDDVEDKICWFVAFSHVTNPDTFDNRIKDHGRSKLGKELLFEYYDVKDDRKKFLKLYEGINLDEIKDFAEKMKVNVIVYEYDEKKDIYQIDEENKAIINPNYKDFHVLYITNEIENLAHFLFISDAEKLTNSTICPYCKSRWFNKRDKNFQVNYRRHIKRCQKNNGKNVKDIKLDKISQPYIPHILSNKLYLNSILNKTEYEYTKN